MGGDAVVGELEDLVTLGRLGDAEDHVRPVAPLLDGKPPSGWRVLVLQAQHDLAGVDRRERPGHERLEADGGVDDGAPRDDSRLDLAPLHGAHDEVRGVVDMGGNEVRLVCHANGLLRCACGHMRGGHVLGIGHGGHEPEVFVWSRMLQLASFVVNTAYRIASASASKSTSCSKRAWMAAHISPCRSRSPLMARHSRSASSGSCLSRSMQVTPSSQSRSPSRPR